MRVLDGANSGSGYGQMTLMSSLQQIGCLMTSPLGALAFVADLILRPPPESVVVPGLSGMEGIDRVPIPLPAITRPIVRVADSIPVPGPTTVFQKTKEKEYKRMPDQDLSDDMLKTVHYEIKFKLRPYECTF